jgi:periplasmic protein TonB
MMSNSLKFEPSTPLSNNDSLLVAVFIATVAHIIIALGVNFTAPKPEKINRSIDVTLAITPSPKAPKEAKFLAQDNQVGAGEKAKKPEPPKQQLPSTGNGQTKQVSKAAPAPSKPKETPKVLTQQKAITKVVAATKPAVDEKQQEEQPAPKLSAESLQQQISAMGTEIRQSQQSSDQTKIVSVNSVSTHKYVAAQYLKDWESKVERTGNLNYPEAAIKKNFSATLTMDVGIKSDGSIYTIRITHSSGIPALDEAAKNIVKMSAPFPPLPLDLRKEVDILVITRVWKFSDESGMTTR